MISFFAQKKLLTILKSKPLSSAMKYEIRKFIRTSGLEQRAIINTVYKAMEFWDDLREYDNAAKLEKYFLSNVTFENKQENESELDTESASEPIQSINFIEENDTEETFFDDDIYYTGLFKKTDTRKFKDYLVLGEDEYDSKRNKNLFRVCFLASLPISVVLVFGLSLLLHIFSIRIAPLWLIPFIVIFATSFSIIGYLVLEPRDLTWTYDRVITYLYTLFIVYIGIILCGVVVIFVVWRSGSTKLEKKFYFRTDAFVEFVRNNPESAEGHMKLAYAYLSNDEYEKALSEINITLTLDPNLDEAIDLERAIVETYVINKEAVIHFSNGMLYRFIKQDSSALTEFKEAVELYPDLATAHFYLGLSYFARRDYQKAWIHANKAHDLGYERAKDLIRELGKYFELPPIY